MNSMTRRLNVLIRLNGFVDENIKSIVILLLFVLPVNASNKRYHSNARYLYPSEAFYYLVEGTKLKQMLKY